MIFFEEAIFVVKSGVGGFFCWEIDLLFPFLDLEEFSIFVGMGESGCAAWGLCCW